MAYTEHEVRALTESLYRERFEDEVRPVGGQRGYSMFRAAVRQCEAEARLLLDDLDG